MATNGRIKQSTLTRCRRSLVTFLTLIVVIAMGLPVCAEEGWPFLRGPQFDGHSGETNLGDQWPAAGPPVLWVRNLGQGYSAFVAMNDRVYTQAQNVTGQYLYCLEADTGATIWEYRYDWPYEAAGVYPGPRSTPTIFKDSVYFTSPDGLLGCVQASNGNLKWSLDLLSTYGIEGCDFGYACSPTLIDDLVILPVGGAGAGVVAFDAMSGREIWKSTSEPASYTPAYPIALDDEPLVVAYMQNCVLILNREDGSVRYKQKLSQGYDEHSAWPIYQEPMLWLSGPFQAGSYCLDLSQMGKMDGRVTEVWRTKLMSNDVCSSVLVDGHLFGFDIKDVQSKTHRPSRGVFRCLDFRTGNQTWSIGTGQPRRSGNADQYARDLLQSGIIVADEKLIILNELGELILLQADPKQCSELARCQVLSGELTWTPPCLNNGRVFVRNQTQAVCVYLGDPDDLGGRLTQTVSDLSQRIYYDLAEVVLAVEPEYAFDVPHDRWLVMWYLVGLGILIASKLLAAVIAGGHGFQSKTALLEVGLAIVAGALGTTVLGHLTGEFLFTWHVCLYAAFEFVAVCSFPPALTDRSASPIRKRLPLLLFLLVSFLFYSACRRLSLVFEWAFMIGFPGAVVVLWPAYRFKTLCPNRLGTKLAVTSLAYTFFYGMTVAFLKSRY